MDKTRSGERDTQRWWIIAAAWLTAAGARPAATQVTGRAWFCANLLGVAAIGAAFWSQVQPALLVGWACFAVLNVLLQLARNATPRLARGHAGSRASRSFPLLLGLSWGGAVLLFLPYATPTAAGVLLAAIFAIALSAIPVCTERRNTYGWFITPLVTLSLLALALDQRYHLAIPWVVLAAATLFINATAYYRPLVELRRALAGAVGLAGDVPAGPRPLWRENGMTANFAANVSTRDEATVVPGEHDQRILDALGDAVVTTDAEGRLAYVNPVGEVLLGVSLAQARGLPVERCVRITAPSDERNRARELFEAAIAVARVQAGSDDCELRRPDGIVYGIDYVVTSIRDRDGAFAGASFVLRDVTEKRQRAESIVWRASHDPLTGTINRAEFESRLDKLLQRSGADHTPIHTLLFIDVDHFKFINDSYGHAAGDVALRALAELLRSRIRGADTLARVGGDEFAALLYSCGTEKARLIAEGLRAAVEKHEFRWNAIDLPVSISIGIVEFDRRASCTSEIMHAADSACYGAKAVGRNRVQLFNPRDGAQVQEAQDFALVKEIQGALHGNQLQLYFQPLCETIAGAPALRCELSAGIRRTDGELMHRAEFADVARRFQLSADLDCWVVKAAFDTLRLDHPALRAMDLVLLPLTEQAIVDDRVQQYILDLLREHAAVAARVGFVLQDWDDSSSLRHFAASLKQVGCAIMVEDAGFGSRGIELVKSLGADFLGIRGSLVRNVERSSVDYEAVLGLSRIARSLGMQTVAEQVDSPTLRATLAAMGVDLIKCELSGGPRPVAMSAAHC